MGLTWSIQSKFYLSATLLILLLITSCTPARRSFSPGEIPVAKPVTPAEEQYGHQLLNEFSKEYELDYDHPRRAEVDHIMNRITNALGAAKLPWHVHVFKAPQVKNAAATKGNHIFVWTGMIDATKDESELAGIISHEVAHVISRHTDASEEENLRKILVNIGAMAAGAAANIAIGGTGGSIAGDIASNATGKLGAGILVYPYDRAKELEADEIGLFISAKAGYDPKSVINFWQRALSDPAFSSGIPFFSTHPPAADRLTNLQRLIPAAEMAQNKTAQNTQNKNIVGQNTNHNTIKEIAPPLTVPSNQNINIKKEYPKIKPTVTKTVVTPNSTGNNSNENLETKTKGIKSDQPLTGNDSFDVGPDIMKERFGK